jgi:parallel beta-helix repeat protein
MHTMKHKTSTISFVFLLILASIAALCIKQVSAKTITVPGQYPTIQEAINHAKSGDTILVGNGTYFENVAVNKTVTLIGESTANTTIDCGNHYNTITVTANNVVIEGFTVTHSSGAYPNSGIFLDNVKNARVFDNSVTLNNGYGVFVMWGTNDNVSYNVVMNNAVAGIRVDGNASRAVVANNTVKYNQQDGVFLYYAYNVRVENNTVTDNVLSGITVQGGSLNVTVRRNWVENNGNNVGAANSWYHGIFVFDSNGTSITENNITSNKGLGLYVYQANKTSVVRNTFTTDGMVARDSYGNKVQNNTVNGKPLAYLEGVSKRTVTNAGQVVLVNCTNIQVKNLNLSDTDVGVVLFLTNSCVLSSNTMTNGYVGIRMYNSSRNIISGNDISLNSYHGVYRVPPTT